MPDVISLSRRDRKIGAVPLFGLIRLISSAVIGNTRSGLLISARSRMKKPNEAPLNVRPGPPET